MKVILIDAENLEAVQRKSEQSVMALGFFDGLHKGHQTVIQIAKQHACKKQLPLAVMSFFPHPKTVITNSNVDYLMPIEEKTHQLKKLGVDLLYIVHFTKEFASLAPQTFVEQYLMKLGVKVAVAGFDYKYGFKGEGQVHMIAEQSQQQIQVVIAPKVEMAGEKISSTLCRNLLKAGHVEKIYALCGRPYSIQYDLQEGIEPYFTLPKRGHYNVEIHTTQHIYSNVIEVMDEHFIRGVNIQSSDKVKIVFYEADPYYMKELVN
ncbi:MULTISPECIES: FAD synthetase family protein [unclassified Psychrobacillus]|uniref:FAD synthetase family protein n=1 Tax=unclassified Psychrobacillus TaxID=2636677 RepID=UPI0030F7C28E